MSFTDHSIGGEMRISIGLLCWLKRCQVTTQSAELGPGTEERGSGEALFFLVNKMNWE